MFFIELLLSDWEIFLLVVLFKGNEFFFFFVRVDDVLDCFCFLELIDWILFFNFLSEILFFLMLFEIFFIFFVLLMLLFFEWICFFSFGLLLVFGLFFKFCLRFFCEFVFLILDGLFVLNELVVVLMFFEIC